MPPIVLEEGGLRFEFDTRWRGVLKWDDSKTYRDGIGRLPSTKAVDILCRGPGQCVFIEIKDFRRHRIENKARLSSGELQQEVAQKVRDTLAGVLGAAKSDSNEGFWKDYVKALASDEDVLVVLWLEEDFTPPPGDGTQAERWKARLSIVQNVLKQQLRWLTARVLVTSVREVSRLPGVKVSSITPP